MIPSLSCTKDRNYGEILEKSEANGIKKCYTNILEDEIKILTNRPVPPRTTRIYWKENTGKEERKEKRHLKTTESDSLFV